MSKTMMLISSEWGEQRTPTFRMIPVHNDCPYNEVIYDPAQATMAIISKDKKESLHNVIKLDSNGGPILAKGGKRIDGNPFQEERRLIESYYEYYISDQQEIEKFIKMFAINADTFDYGKFFPVQEKLAA